MSLTIRVPQEAERETVGDVIQVSLNLDPARRASRLPRMPLKDFRVAFDGNRAVSTAAEFRFLQWFGGRSIPMSGIFGVATLPEHRGGGVMREVVSTLMREAHGRGAPLTALYPAVLGPYRSLGYQIAGTFNEHRLRIDAIPAGIGDAAAVREYVPEDLPAVRACWSRAMRHANGTIEPDGDGWWVHRTFNPQMDPTLRAVVVPGADGVEAFASFTRTPDPGTLDVAFGLECEPLAAVSETGLRSLLAYLRGYRGLGQWVQWAGAPNDPATMVIPEHRVLRQWGYPWMLRLLHVEQALRGRGWPAGARAEAVFAVDDPMFPGNAGPWRLTVADGEVEVAAAQDVNPKPISIGTLSAMFSGYLRPHDAVRVGLMDGDDPAVASLATLFAGADPWTGLFF
ncbi:MAG: GNAT family N-acetyltransferase [Actinomycetota bacterium]